MNTQSNFKDLLQHSSWIKNLAYATLKDHALAEDVSQEVLIKAVENQNRSGKVLQAWLAAVTRNLSKNELRSMIRRRNREQRVALQSEDVAEAGDKELLHTHQHLLTAIEALSAPNQRVIILRFYKELSFAEISKRLEISVGNARVRLHRALAELRRCLSQSGGDWRASCLLVAPLATAPTGSNSIIGGGVGNATTFSFGHFAAGMLLLAGAWFGWSQLRSSDTELLDNSQLMVAAEADNWTAMLENEQPESARILLATDDENTDRNQAQAYTCDGQVLYQGLPVADAEVTLWQNNQLYSCNTNMEGVFQVGLADKNNAAISVRWNGMATTSGWFYGSRGPIRIHLGERTAEESEVQVLDGLSKQPVINADVNLWINWAGFNQSGMVKENALEWAFSGATDGNGKLNIPEALAGLNFRVSAVADGYLTNFTDGQTISLYPTNELPVQFIDQNGIPLANVAVREGRFVSEAKQTDGNGFLNSISEWELAPRTQEALALPKSLIVELADGRIWERRAADFLDEDVEVHSDRIQLTVNTSPIQVRAQEIQLPAGKWLEVHCEVNSPNWAPGGYDSSRGNWVPEIYPEPVWQSITAGEWTQLDHGWLTPISTITVRLMPNAYNVGVFPVVDGKADLPIDLGLLRVKLLGWPIAENTEVMLVGSLGEECLFVNGVAELLVNRNVFYMLRVRNQATGDFLAIESTLDEAGATALGRGQSGTYLSMTTTGEALQEIEITATDSRYHKVLVRVNGLPIADGRFGREVVGLDGVVSMLLKSDGSPDFSGRGKGQLSIQVDPSLRSQSGGPILTSFNFSRNEIVPGLLHQDSNGLWIWDLELTSVVLKVPPIPGGLGSRVFYSEIGYVTNDINWPPPHQVGGFGGNQLLIPEEGGDIEFQVPAGQYIFHVGRNVSFGGVDGVYLQPSGVTILEPDSDS